MFFMFIWSSVDLVELCGCFLLLLGICTESIFNELDRIKKSDLKFAFDSCEILHRLEKRILKTQDNWLHEYILKEIN